MADPKRKSIDPIQIQPFFLRRVPSWVAPGNIPAERWRMVVRQQPLAMLCRTRLITYLQTMPITVRARKPKDEDKLADDIQGYTDMLDGIGVDGGVDTDTLLDLLWQDALDLPVGGNMEILRYPDGKGPYKTEHPKGHVYGLYNIDGATMLPTGDKEKPMAQVIPGKLNTQPIYFEQGEIGRVLISPRPEWNRKGYGMAPPEAIFLAIQMLIRGDTYYASLLLDTPEAGVLDLLDMSKDDAMEWIASARDLLMGIDPLKIPVLYQHEKPAVWIPFGRPPSDIMYDSTTIKYARVTTAGYWLSLSDLGLEGGADTLTGQIRDERRARLSGFGLVREKTIGFLNREVVPPDLEVVVIERDEEALYNRYRAYALGVQAMKGAKEAGVMSAKERQQQLKKDGLITVEVEEPEEQPVPPAGPMGGLPGQTGAPFPGGDAEETGESGGKRNGRPSGTVKQGRTGEAGQEEERPARRKRGAG